MTSSLHHFEGLLRDHPFLKIHKRTCRIHLLFLALTCLLNLVTLEDSKAQHSDITPSAAIITSEEIRESGITRLHELFTLFDNWTGFSINGQEWEGAAVGLTTYENAGWTVLIDNQPVRLSTLNWQSFNQLPVTLQEIRKIIVIDTPLLYQGIFTGRGLIHIITNREQSGWHTEIRFAAGNEINDPGPYEYTDLDSPNEERAGPDVDLVLNYNSGRWFIQASGSVMRHKSTDIPIEQRIKDMLYTGAGFEDPTNLKRTAHMRGGYRSSRVAVNIQGGAVIYRDFPFFRSYGREIPILFKNRYGGIDASMNTGNDITFTLRSTLDYRNPDYSPNRENFHFDFSQFDITHHLGVIRDKDDRRISSGLILNQSDASGNFQNLSRQLRIWSLYVQWTEKLTDHFSLTTEIKLAAEDAKWSGKSRTAAARAEWRIYDHHTLHPYLSHSEQLPAETQDLWFWMERGYAGVTPLGVSMPSLPNRKPSALTASGLHWNFSVTEQLKMNFQGYLNHHTGYLLSRQSYRMVQPHQWFEHDGVQFYPDEAFTTAGLNATIQFDSFANMNHTLFFGTRVITDSTGEMKNALREIPDHRFRFATAYTPAAGFQLWSSFRLQSDVIWHEFDNVDGEIYRDQQHLSENIFRSRTGRLSQLDIGGRKSFWSEKLHLSLILKNLFNQPNTYHPAGADQDLTFTVQLEMSL